MVIVNIEIEIFLDKTTYLNKIVLNCSQNFFKKFITKKLIFEIKNRDLFSIKKIKDIIFAFFKLRNNNNLLIEIFSQFVFYF